MSVITKVGRVTSRDSAFEFPRWGRGVDLFLVGSLLAIAGAGVLMIYSAGRPGYSQSGGAGFAIRQSIWVVLGLGIAGLISVFDYRRLRSSAGWLYGAMLVLLLAVVSPLGAESKGAQAWFQFGGFQIQPSEYAKVVVIVAMAAYAVRQHRGVDGRFFWVMTGVAGLPVALIMLQPDLGTSLVFAVVAFVMLWIAGAPGRNLMILLAMGILAAVAVIQLGILKDYQLDRLGAFLDPENNTQQSAYNLNQSKIAIGSGGIGGKGLFLGTQTNLSYVPEQHTDFIFTVVAEELGLLGSGTVLGLFGILVWRIWVAARKAPDVFGRLICSGVLAMMMFQIFENVGMAMGIMPITGIPLPLVSYGGSATLATFVALGLVLSVRRRSEI